MYNINAQDTWGKKNSQQKNIEHSNNLKIVCLNKIKLLSKQVFNALKLLKFRNFVNTKYKLNIINKNY